MMSDSLIYTQSQNGIHRFYWGNVELDTIHAYVNLFRALHESIPEDSVVCLLHDYRDTGTPSFSTITSFMKDFKMRGDITLRVAHLYSDTIYPMIMKNASIVSGFNANRQFFRADEEQQAIDWLLDF